MTTTTTETGRRLVNCYRVSGLTITERVIYWTPLGIADGDPGRAFHDAVVAGADGILIVDAHTGERWFVPITEPSPEIDRLCSFCESNPAEPGADCCDNGFCKAEAMVTR